MEECVAGVSNKAGELTGGFKLEMIGVDWWFPVKNREEELVRHSLETIHVSERNSRKGHYRAVYCKSDEEEYRRTVNL